MFLLIDTNVWLDNYIPDRPRHRVVGELLSEAMRQEHDLLYAVSSIKDVYYLVGHAYKRQARNEGRLDDATSRAIDEIAWACIANMDEIATAVGADGSDVWLARRYRSLHADFEDDLVLAACRRAHADYLVTNDRKLLAHADVCAKTPRQMVELLKVLS